MVSKWPNFLSSQWECVHFLIGLDFHLWLPLPWWIVCSHFQLFTGSLSYTTCRSKCLSVQGQNILLSIVLILVQYCAEMSTDNTQTIQWDWLFLHLLGCCTSSGTLVCTHEFILTWLRVRTIAQVWFQPVALCFMSSPTISHILLGIISHCCFRFLQQWPYKALCGKQRLQTMMC